MFIYSLFLCDRIVKIKNIYHLMLDKIKDTMYSKKVKTKVTVNVNELIESRLDWATERMEYLESIGAPEDDIQSIAYEYCEWGVAEDGDTYGMMYLEYLNGV